MKVVKEVLRIPDSFHIIFVWPSHFIACYLLAHLFCFLSLEHKRALHFSVLQHQSSKAVQVFFFCLWRRNYGVLIPSNYYLIIINIISRQRYCKLIPTHFSSMLSFHWESNNCFFPGTQQSRPISLFSIFDPFWTMGMLGSCKSHTKVRIVQTAGSVETGIHV